MTEKIIYNGNYVRLTEMLYEDKVYEKAYVKGAVIVYPQHESGKFYFIKEYRPHEEIKERWKPVTGFLEDDLTWEENSQKELQEEIGKKANKITLLSHVKNRGSVNVDKYFVLAQGLTDSKLDSGDDEEMILDKKLFSLEELVTKTISGELICNFDSLGLFFLQDYFNKQKSI